VHVRHGGDNRGVGDKRVIGEAISVHDAALAAVTIKPYNRTIESRSSRGVAPSLDGGENATPMSILTRPRPNLRAYLRWTLN